MELARCSDCKYYDPTPFPENNGKIAVCKNKNGSYGGKVGIYTLADKECFEPREGVRVITYADKQ